MAEFPALPLWTDALLGDTYHLSPAQFGAYMRLLICAWRTKGCSLPNDDAYLGKLVGDHKNWHRLKPYVLPFFVLGEDGRFRQLRLLDEHDYCSRRVKRASAGGRAKALKRLNRDSANAVLNECSNLPPFPIPTPTKKERKKVSKYGEVAEKPFIALPPEWNPNASHYAYGKKKGLSVDDVTDEALGMRSWAEANGTKKQNWDSMFMGWMKNHKPNGNGNGHGRQVYGNEKSLTAAARRLREQLTGGSSESGVRNPEAGENVWLLPQRGRE